MHERIPRYADRSTDEVVDPVTVDGVVAADVVGNTEALGAIAVELGVVTRPHQLVVVVHRDPQIDVRVVEDRRADRRFRRLRGDGAENDAAHDEGQQGESDGDDAATHPRFPLLRFVVLILIVQVLLQPWHGYSSEARAADYSYGLVFVSFRNRHECDDSNADECRLV